ncbi:hypothetical protein GcC1_082030 [Golovinomyces cichoracearum]|uniref:Uncharacterized protein n=1 Tax=Golovinomyces cichoracearum TaxID=62708 RepID=A0A420IK37_9PEZI|nr:hypothetical protein GcC1_082030 [Golovinomyces cichoracearum]
MSRRSGFTSLLQHQTTSPAETTQHPFKIRKAKLDRIFYKKVI